MKHHIFACKGAKITHWQKITCNFCFVLSTLALFACVGMKQTKTDNMKASTTKVIGYLLSRGDLMLDQIAWDRLSHLILMGITPDSDGIWNLRSGANSSALVQILKAQNPNMRILADVVGGKDTYAEWMDEKESRAVIISSLVKYLSDNGYDGANVEIEASPNWENFILETKAALKEKNMILSGGLDPKSKPNVTRKGAEAFDWINIFSFNEKGEWNPNDPGPNSSIAGAKDAFQYFHENGAGIDASNLAIGLPTFGFWFIDGGQGAGSFAYSGVVSKDPAHADVDEFSEKGRTYYYNGRPTIRKKVEMARDWGSHIMLFRLRTDAMNEYSILKEIGRSMDELGMKLD